MADADPFFAEDDDGEFDDLYSSRRGPAQPVAANKALDAGRAGPAKASASASASAAPRSGAEGGRRREDRDPWTPASSDRSFQSYSVASASDDAPQIRTPTPTTIERAPPASRRRRERPRRKRSQELFAVEWERDDDVTACFACSTEFSMLKRKHHCRQCGRVICSDCSNFWRFPSTHKKHRVCSFCNVQLASRDQPPISASAASSGTSVETPTPTPPTDHKGKLRRSLVGFLSTDKQPRSNPVTPADGPRHEQERKQIDRGASREEDQDLFNTTDDTWFVDPIDSPRPNRQKPADTPNWHDRSPHREEATTNRLDPPSQPTRRSHTTFVKGQPVVVGAPNDSLFSTQSTRTSDVAHIRGHREDEFSIPDFKHVEGPSGGSSTLSSQEQDNNAVSMMPNWQNISSSQPTSSGNTYYSADADDLVVDEMPDYYESVSTSQRSQLTPGYAPPNIPVAGETPVVEGPLINDQSSCFDQPARVHGHEPVTVSPNPDNRRAEVEKKHGFTHTIRRLFGFANQTDTSSSKPQEERIDVALDQSTTGEATKQPTHHASSDAPYHRTPSPLPQPETNSGALNHQEPRRQPQLGYSEMGESDFQLVDLQRPNESFDGRYTMVDHDRFRETVVDESRFRHTMAGYAVPSIMDTESAMTASTRGSVRADTLTHQRKLEMKVKGSLRKRRDTFESLFEAPTPSSQTISTPSRAWLSQVHAQQTAGGSRFDANEEIIEDDVSLSQLLDLPGPSAMQEPMNDAGDASSITTRNFNASSGYRTENYDFRADMALNNQIQNPRRTIMDDIKSNTVRPSFRNDHNSVDDFFSDFEKPNDYVFDTHIGTYVPRASQEVQSSSAYPSRQNYFADSIGRTYHQGGASLSVRDLSDIKIDKHADVTDGALTAVDDDSDRDVIDATIVSKISSLEGELAALKLLLQKRSVHSPTHKRRVPNRAQARKTSIFDSDDEAHEAESPVNQASTILVDEERAVEQIEAKRRDYQTDSRKQAKRRTKKRQDSFAQLFEDGSTDQQGSTNYESLFQIGNDNDSDQNSDSVGDKKRVQSSQRRPTSERDSMDKLTPSEDETPSRFRNNTSSVSRPDRRASKSRSNKRTFHPEKPTKEDLSQGAREVVVEKTQRQEEKKDVIDSLFDSDHDDKFHELFADAETADVSDSEPVDQNNPSLLENEHVRTSNKETPRVDNSFSMEEASVYHENSDDEFMSNLRGFRRNRTEKNHFTADETNPVQDENVKSDTTYATKSSRLHTQAPMEEDTDDDDDRRALPSSRAVDDMVQDDAPTELPSVGEASDHAEAQVSVDYNFTELESSDFFDPLALLETDQAENPKNAKHRVSRQSRKHRASSDAPINSPDESGAPRADVFATQDSLFGIEIAPVNEQTQRDQDDGTKQVRGIWSSTTLFDASVELAATMDLEDDIAIDFRSNELGLGGTSFLDVSPAISRGIVDSITNDQEQMYITTSLPVESAFEATYGADGIAHSKAAKLSPSNSWQGDDQGTDGLKPEDEVISLKNPSLVTSQRGGSLRADSLVSDAQGADTEDEAIVLTNGSASRSSAPVPADVADCPNHEILDAATQGDFDLDWQMMQEQEKERRKKLQLKQRQARDKLKKQSGSSRGLTKSGLARIAAATTNGDVSEASQRSKSENNEKRQRKKRTTQNEGNGSSQHATTRRRSRKVRDGHDSLDGSIPDEAKPAATDSPPRSLTDL